MTQREPVLFDNRDEMPDLAPMICRERLVIEGTPQDPIDAGSITRYLLGLSDQCEMKVLLDPVTHRSDRYGWAGWIHWEASGVHVYAWEEPMLFFSVSLPEAGRRFAAGDVDLHDIVFEGRGLEDAMRPMDLERALDDIAALKAAQAGRIGLGRR